MGEKRVIVQGEGSDKTILRLIDKAAGFNNPKKPKALLSMGAIMLNEKSKMGQAFRNSVINLSIEIGANNPGAVGLHYLKN